MNALYFIVMMITFAFFMYNKLFNIDLHQMDFKWILSYYTFQTNFKYNDTEVFQAFFIY